MGEQLYPYQIEGAKFLAQRGKAALFDPQGLGKTPQAIRAADLVEARQIVVCCPAAVKENWRREFARFSSRTLRVDVVQGRNHHFDALADVYVVNYDLLTSPAVMRALKRTAPDLVILDEAHFLKNPRAKRTRAVYGPLCNGEGGLTHGAKVFALTGTPIPNNPSELWPLLRAVGASCIRLPDNSGVMTLPAFVERFCTVRTTRFGEAITGGRNLDDLKNRLAPFALRRRKEDVLPDLPPFRVELAHLSSRDAAGKLARAMTEAPGGEDLARALREARDDTEAADALAMAAPAMSTLRRLTGTLKAPLVAEMVADDLDAGMGKVVVFAIHRDVIASIRDALTARGYGVVVLDGSSGGEGRQTAIDAFQNDPGTHVFIGQITAAGTGITLTAASNAVFAEMSWVPADNAQAAMRIHRIGQKNSVLVRLATLPGTVDETVAQTVRRKTRVISAILD